MQTMRLVDDTGRLIRAPEVRFSSDEIGLDQFGYNIDNRALMAALEQRAAELSGLTRFDDEADDDHPHDADGRDPTRGRDNHCRHALWSAPTAGNRFAARPPASTVKRRDLSQSALTFNVGHSRPHRNISTEFHTPQGPCVFVPLPGNRCSVVWVSAPQEAERLMALSDDELSEAAEKQSHSILGRIQVEPGRHLFPLAIEQPRQFANAPHRAGRRSRACAAADRRAGPQHGTARRRRYRRYRGRGDVVGRRPRLAAGADALRLGAARGCH